MQILVNIFIFHILYRLLVKIAKLQMEIFRFLLITIDRRIEGWTYTYIYWWMDKRVDAWVGWKQTDDWTDRWLER